MKGVVVLCLMFVGVIQGLPATPSKKDEVELVPRKGSPFGDQPIVDTGALFPDDDESIFGGFQYFQSLMTRIRQQMDDLLKTLPFHGSSNETDIGDFPISGGLPIVPRFPSIDLGKGNTTSVTKVIDGHKVVINETEYKKEDDFGGAYFKVRIIDLKPDSSESTPEEGKSTETPALPSSAEEVTKDREPLETNSFENEIPKGREDSTTTLETFDEVDSTTPNKISENLQSYDLRGDTKVNDLVSDKTKYYNPDAEFIDKEPIIVPIDLNRDTYINELASRFGKPINPDAEVFIPGKNTLEDFDEPTQNQPPRYRDNIETFDEDNTLYPSTKLPIDLSRDTLVNDLLINKKENYDKDAEFIPPSLQYQPKKIQKLERLESLDFDEPPNLSRDIHVNQLAASSGRPAEELAEFVDLEGRGIDEPKYEYRRFR